MAKYDSTAVTGHSMSLVAPSVIWTPAPKTSVLLCRSVRVIMIVNLDVSWR